MQKITNVYELTELPRMVTDGFISVRQHSMAPLRIYNYTAKAQCENVWNAAILTCRGLIADETGEVVARPFSKFFYLDHVDVTSKSPFRGIQDCRRIRSCLESTRSV